MIKCKTIANKLFGRKNSESGRIRKKYVSQELIEIPRILNFWIDLRWICHFFSNVKTSIQQAGELKDN